MYGATCACKQVWRLKPGCSLATYGIVLQLRAEWGHRVPQISLPLQTKMDLVVPSSWDTCLDYV